MNDFVKHNFQDLNPSQKFYKISPLSHSALFICDSGEIEIFLVANLMLKSIIMSMINVLAHLTSDYFFFLQNKNYMCYTA